MLRVLVMLWCPGARVALSYAASSRLGLAWARRQHFSENSDMGVFRGELETKGVSGPDAVSEILVSLMRNRPSG